MREFVKIHGWEAILDILNGFSDVFPHLGEKIESMEAYAQKLARHAEFYVGRENGELFGLVVFYANDRATGMAYISLIGVRQTARKQGLGFWLLEQCQQQARRQGMTQISLEVDCDNANAIAFYERNGFAVSGHTQRSSMYMQKPLCGDDAT